ncbi:MAG: hypothetical protein V3V20_12485 [Algisphaera sp.]
MHHCLRRARILIWLWALVLAGAWAFPAAAQVGSALVAVPWAPGQTLSVKGYALGEETQTEDDFLGPGDDLNLARVVGFGRYRLDAENPNSLSVGWLYDHIEMKTDDVRLPARLEASAVAVGANLGTHGDWSVGYTAGVGFAGDLPYADGEAWYGLGSLYARHQLKGTPTFITLFLDYDGSRSFLPDTPIPALQYTVIESPTLTYSIGLPYSSLSWQPSDRVSIDAKFLVPMAGSAEASYKLDKQWSAYVLYEISTRGYHLADDEKHRRLFFSQSRSELGLRYTFAQSGIQVNAAGGYAFDQEFTRGFDTRHTELIRDVGDAVYVRVGVSARF